MAKKSKDILAKEKTYQYYGFNITIQGKKRNNDAYYYTLIRRIYSEEVFKDIGGEKGMTLRLAFETNADYKSKKYRILYGIMTRFTLLNGKRWLDRANRDFKDVEIPSNTYPNVYESDFIFVPAAHKLFVKQNSKLAPAAIAQFLRKALAEVINPSEIVKVSILSSQDAIDSIISAKSLMNLEIEVSYTNDDAGDAAQELMDDMYKRAHIGNATSIFKPDGHGIIDAKAPIVQGLLGLAKENGNATASVVGGNGKVKKIITSDYPEKFRIQTSDAEQKHISLFNYVMNRWRSQNDKRKN